MWTTDVIFTQRQ